MPIKPDQGSSRTNPWSSKNHWTPERIDVPQQDGLRSFRYRPQTPQPRVELTIKQPWEQGWRAEKDLVKELGARWDPRRKKWWITSGRADQHLFARWIPFHPEIVRPPKQTGTCTGCGVSIEAHVEMCSSCREVHPIIKRRRRAGRTDNWLRQHGVRITLDKQGNVVTERDLA